MFVCLFVLFLRELRFCFLIFIITSFFFCSIFFFNPFSFAGAATVVLRQGEIQRSSKSGDETKPSNEGKSNASEWSEEKVQTWLKENKLPGSICSSFSECGINGKDLKEMYNQYCEAPQEFKNDVKSEYKLGFASITKLIRILKELFELSTK